ncbi:unnamed protein product [Calypogeia fissa]
MDLASIRESLIRQEDTIIRSVLERAQYKINAPTYIPKPELEGSLLDYIFRETEKIHAKAGRYNNPDEHAFFPGSLPESFLHSAADEMQQQCPLVLHKAADKININPQIWDLYFDDILPKVAADGDDGNHGSAATCDIQCLQALSRRIHFGKFVAEVKFSESPEVFEPHIRDQDVEALYKLITFESVEQNVIRRVESKAVVYGQEVGVDGPTSPQTLKIDPKLLGRIYSEWLMPLNKKVQVEYLLHRLG